MPLYDYECKKCGAVTEVLVRGAEDPSPVCDACGGGELRRVVSSFSAPGGGSPGRAADPGGCCAGST